LYVYSVCPTTYYIYSKIIFSSNGKYFVLPTILNMIIGHTLSYKYIDWQI